jgi:membrane protein implicated in regulation of membrane protease activity
MAGSHFSAGDVWLGLSLVMIPLEFLTGTTFAIASGIAFGFTGLFSLMSFGILDVRDQFMLLFAFMALIQTGAYHLYRQRVRNSNHKD